MWRSEIIMSGARPGRWGKPVSDEVGRRVVRRAVDVVFVCDSCEWGADTAGGFAAFIVRGC